MKLRTVLNRVYKLAGIVDGDTRLLRDDRNDNCAEAAGWPCANDARTQVPRNVRTLLVSNVEIFPSTI